jgi:hypothetical protein
MGRKLVSTARFTEDILIADWSYGRAPGLEAELCV